MKVMMIAGSNREHAASTKALRYLAQLLKREGAETRLFDLRERPLPMYGPDEDDEADANVRALKAWAAEADAIVLATPEYHGSMSGALKNALDYLDREHFDGKAVLSVSAAGGAVGVSSLTQLQAIVRNLHGIHSPEWISLGGAQRAFAPDGEPEHAAVKERMQRAASDFLRLAKGLRQGEGNTRG